MKELIHTRPDVLMHDQEVKIHVKVVKIQAKIKQTKTNRQTIKQTKLSPTKQSVP
jgi:hypothetical protein